MTTSTRSTVVGVFADRGQSQEAVRALKQAGFRDDQIGVVAQGHEKDATDNATGSKAAEGSVIGATTGAGVGALWALGIAAGMLPAIGPVVAGGLLMSVLASAGGAAAAGAIVGSLIGLGIPEEEAHYYEGEFKAGRTLVTVKAEGRETEAWSILHRHGAYNRQTSAVHATTATRTEAGQTMQLHEEHLHAHKTPVETGEVRVRKEVITEQQNISVPVTREEVVVERRQATGHASTTNIREGEEIRIPVMEEKVHVDKEAVVKEEVSVGKRRVTDTEHVSGTVRKEQVKVEQEGDVDVRSSTVTPKRIDK